MSSSILVAILAFLGVLVLIYPMTANWFSEISQQRQIVNYGVLVDNAVPSARDQLRLAHEYNDALSSGALLESGRRIPTGQGKSGNARLEYKKMLSVGPDAPMGRVKIDKVGVDLPVYHGTSDRVLLRGAGHLEGTSLPVGGVGTRSVITAHRGLASSEMFTKLDKIGVGDSFTVEVFGEVLVYRVIETKVVNPDENEALRPNKDLDLMTLVTCTPLGINSHRILVTGQRVLPTPKKDIVAVSQGTYVPRFPWWAVFLFSSFVLVCLYVWRSGYPVKVRKARPRHMRR